MEPRTVQTARREEWESVPSPAFVVDADTVHVCAGPGPRVPAHVLCGRRIRPEWEVMPMSRWATGWILCEDCGQVVAEIDRLSGPK